MTHSYIKPYITIVNINSISILSSSDYNTMEYVCSEQCKLWHICRDREIDKFCKDKKYK